MQKRSSKHRSIISILNIIFGKHFKDFKVLADTADNVIKLLLLHLARAVHINFCMFYHLLFVCLFVCLLVCLFVCWLACWTRCFHYFVLFLYFVSIFMSFFSGLTLLDTIIVTIKGLEWAKVSNKILITIRNIMDLWATNVDLFTNNTSIKTNPINYITGVLQGDCLSVMLVILSVNPILFVLSLLSVIV